MKPIRFLLQAVTIVTLFVLVSNCKKDDGSDNKTDVKLYNMATETSGFSWYKNSDALLQKSILSGHSEAFLRTRYNAIAAEKLDESGKVQNSIIFPNGSLIVKELYSDQSTLAKYAILYKDPENSYADSDGWVWGYLEANGTVVEPSSNKTLMNVAIP